jgi:membrane-bound metal-dependent hydrolase YbcI (DUF457 family)
MMARTHRLVGGSTAFVIGAGAGFPIALVGGVSLVAAAASTLPDSLEHPPKLIRKKMPRLAKRLSLPHRQITHYPVIQLSVTLLLAGLLLSISPIPAVFVLYLAGALAIAFVMHSVADAMTIDPRGIALFWPIQRRGYHLLPRPLRARVDTSSPSEIVFSVVWSAFVLCFAYARFRHNIPS